MAKREASKQPARKSAKKRAPRRAPRKAAKKSKRAAKKPSAKKATAKKKKAPAKAPAKRAPARAAAKKSTAKKSTAKRGTFEEEAPATPEVARARTTPTEELPALEVEEIPPDLDVAPFRLIETTTGHYSLLLTEFDEAAPVLEAAGHEAGGYAWAAIAGAVLAEHPELAGHLDLDPEASMFCAYGENRAALEALGLLLAAAWKDHATLARLAAVAPWDEWD